MTSNYEAWNGELYEWPPPDGWYQASDGRWWAPGSGPGPAEQPSAADIEGEAATRVMYRPESQPVTTLDPTPKPIPPMHRTGPNPVVTGPNPVMTGPNPVVTGPNRVTGMGDPLPGARTDANPGLGSGYTGNGVSSPGPDRTTPLLAENTGPIAVVTEDEGRRPMRPMGLHPAVLVAGLLVLAAVGVAVVLAVASGNDGDLATTDDPTVVDGEDAAGSEGGDGQSAGGGDGAMSASEQGTSDDQSMDGSLSAASASDSADGSMSDSMDAGDSGNDATTAGGEPPTAADLTESLEAVTEFRASLDELGITSDDLSAEELVSFGESACGYATGADGLDGYVQARDEALAEADNQELTTEELSSVVDAAVRVFCPEEATRLGL